MPERCLGFMSEPADRQSVRIPRATTKGGWHGWPMHIVGELRDPRPSHALVHGLLVSAGPRELPPITRACSYARS
jgi:hypothetical protein